MDNVLLKLSEDEEHICKLLLLLLLIFVASLRSCSGLSASDLHVFGLVSLNWLLLLLIFSLLDWLLFKRSIRLLIQYLKVEKRWAGTLCCAGSSLKAAVEASNGIEKK